MAPRSFPFTEAHVLVPDEVRVALVGNGLVAQSGGHDPKPVVKWFTPDAGCTWIITELDPDDENRAFGLCDMGHGYPELGWVYLPELAEARGPLGLPIERDLHFRTEHRLSEWAEAARAKGRVVNPAHA